MTLAGRGELTARVVGALWWERSRGAEQIDELVERRARTAVGRYAPTSVKIMQDGVLENFTGAVLEPYLGEDGRPTANRGLSQVEPEALKGYVARLDALGFQPHFHAIGERAVREALDAVEAARAANGLTDTRPHIAHIQVIHPDDLSRFRELDVVANAQPYWACHEGQMDNLTIPFLGPERATWQYPFRSLRAAGATLAMGSDWSVSTANPLLEMEVAVNRDLGHQPRPGACLPARRAARPGRRARRVHRGDCLGQPPRERGRLARGRQGGGPGGPRSRSLRSRRRRDRRGASGRHVHRREPGVRGRRARSLLAPRHMDT